MEPCFLMSIVVKYVVKAKKRAYSTPKAGKNMPVINFTKIENLRENKRKSEVQPNLRFCVATKELIESETTSKLRFLGWLF